MLGFTVCWVSYVIVHSSHTMDEIQMPRVKPRGKRVIISTHVFKPKEINSELGHKMDW